MNKLTKIFPLTLLAVAVVVSACGLVDTERAQEVVDLRTQILEIQINEVDPLVNEIEEMSKLIAPLEREVEDLEAQREVLYDEGRRLGDEFENEMRQRFEVIFMQDDEAHGRYQEILGEEYDSLDKQRRDLERSQEEVWHELDDQITAIGDSFEEERWAKENEIRAGSAAIDAKFAALDEKFDALNKARRDIEAIRWEIQIKYLEIEEKRIAIDDEVYPLGDQLQDLWRLEQEIRERGSDKDYDSLARQLHEQVEEVYDRIEVAWSEFDQQQDLNWVDYDQKRASAWAEYENAQIEIQQKQSQGYDSANQADTAANAAIDLANLEAQYNQDVSNYQALLAEANEVIAQLLEGQDQTSSDSEPTPELAAANSRKTEYESILRELEENFTSRADELNQIISSGSGSVDVPALEREIAELYAQAERDLNASLEQIDAEMFNSETGNEPAVVAGLESQIEALESAINDIWDEQQTYYQSQESEARAIRVIIRQIEDKISPLRDMQRALELESRPLRKQDVSINRESMLLDQQWQILDMERAPLEKERQEYEETGWKELDDWQRNRQREVQDETDEIRKVVERKIRDATREIEDAFYALDEKREDLEESFWVERDGQRRELESQRDALFEEKMAPLELAARGLDTEIATRWEELGKLYDQQSVLTAQLKELEMRVRDLDRRAEFGLLGVISGALDKAKEIERSGEISDFDSFLPTFDGDQVPSGE